MDITIKHKAGKKNTNADVLSRAPKSQVTVEEQPLPQPTLPNAEEISKLQREDSDYAQLIAYLENGTLPQDAHGCRKLVLESRQFHLVGGVLYHENSTEKKVYNKLRRHVWWRGMRNDVHIFCRACSECSSWKTFRPPLYNPFLWVVLSIVLLSTFCSYP